MAEDLNALQDQFNKAVLKKAHAEHGSNATQAEIDKVYAREKEALDKNTERNMKGKSFWQSDADAYETSLKQQTNSLNRDAALFEVTSEKSDTYSDLMRAERRRLDAVDGPVEKGSAADKERDKLAKNNADVKMKVFVKEHTQTYHMGNGEPFDATVIKDQDILAAREETRKFNKETERMEQEKKTSKQKDEPKPEEKRWDQERKEEANARKEYLDLKEKNAERDGKPFDRKKEEQALDAKLKKIDGDTFNKLKDDPTVDDMNYEKHSAKMTAVKQLIGEEKSKLPKEQGKEQKKTRPELNRMDMEPPKLTQEQAKLLANDPEVKAAIKDYDEASKTGARGDILKTRQAANAAIEKAAKENGIALPEREGHLPVLGGQTLDMVVDAVHKDKPAQHKITPGKVKDMLKKVEKGIERVTEVTAKDVEAWGKVAAKGIEKAANFAETMAKNNPDTKLDFSLLNDLAPKIAGVGKTQKTERDI